MDRLLSLDIATVFAVFYAIVFGGTLNRLSIFSAFWKDDVGEDLGKWIERLVWSTLWFTIAPAIYFAVVVHSIAGATSPGDPFWKWFWAVVGVFLSVLALNAFYRFWLAIVLARGVEARSRPINEGEGRWRTLDRYYRLRSKNYLKGAAVSVGLASFGLLILYLIRRCLP